MSLTLLLKAVSLPSSKMRHCFILVPPKTFLATPSLFSSRFLFNPLLFMLHTLFASSTSWFSFLSYADDTEMNFKYLLYILRASQIQPNKNRTYLISKSFSAVFPISFYTATISNRYEPKVLRTIFVFFTSQQLVGLPKYLLSLFSPCSRHWWPSVQQTLSPPSFNRIPVLHVSTWLCKAMCLRENWHQPLSQLQRMSLDLSFLCQSW